MATFPTRGHRYDVIVVGAGIAGSEAAYACAHAGRDTLLVTTSLDTVYNMVWDQVRLSPPAGTLMRALWREHAGADGSIAKQTLHRAAKYRLERQDGLHLLQSNVTALRVDQRGRIEGVETWEGVERLGRPVALCVGSFLHARLTLGTLTEAAGRLSEMAYDELYQDLVARGVALREAVMAADAAAGAPPYQVRCGVLEPTSVAGDGYRVAGVPGLYAAGLCARGYLPFEQAALDGARLGRALLAAPASS